MIMGVARVARFRSGTISCALIVTLANVWLVPAHAQSGSAPARPQAEEGRVENTQVVINGAMVNVSYDLVASRPQSTFAVELEASPDGGKTYTLKPKTLTGDVGPGIAAGAGKKLVWEAAKDTDNLQLAQLKFRVVAKSEASRSMQSTAAPPAGAPPAGQAQSVPAVPLAKPVLPQSAGGRSTLLWPSLGMLGGGVLLAALGAAGSLKADSPDLSDCLSYANFYSVDSGFCDDLRRTDINKPIVGAGLGIAAAGAVLLVLGKRRASSASRLPSIAPLRRGFVVYHAVRF